MALLQTTGGKYELNIVLCRNRNGHHNSEHKDTCIIGHHKKNKEYEQYGSHQKNRCELECSRKTRHSSLSIYRNQCLCYGLDTAILHCQYSDITLKYNEITNKK